MGAGVKVAKRNRPSVLWMLRRFGHDGPNGYVQIGRDGRVRFQLDAVPWSLTWGDGDSKAVNVILDRRTARLLAKRILLALEETA